MTFLSVALLTAAPPPAGSVLASALLRLAAFVGILLLAYAVTKWLAKSRRALGGGGNLAVLEGAGLAQGAQIAIVRAGGRYFLVGAAKESVTLLAELSADELAMAEQQGAPMKVWEYFSRARKESSRHGKSDTGKDE